MAGRKSSRGGDTGPGRDDARREQERLERARRRAEREAGEAKQQAARESRRPINPARSWTDDEWSEADWTPTGPAHEAEGYAAPTTRAGQERQRAFAPLTPATSRRRAAAPAAPPPPVPAPGAAPRAGAGAAPRARGARAPRDRERSGTPRFALPFGLPGLPALPEGFATAGAFVSARRTAFAAGFAGIVLLAIVVLVLGGGSGGVADTPAAKEADAKKAAQARWAKSKFGVPTKVKLPPKTRIVAFAGAPHAKALGILGTTSFEKAAAKLKNQSTPYARPTRHVLRAYDLIATVASASPGPSGKYRTRQPAAVIERYLRAARRDHATLILDVQPGQSNFVDEIKPLEKWLRQPDVQLALDPEWRMRPGVVPGTQIGYVSGGELNAALARVAAIVKAGHLPPKMVLVHRFTDGMIKNFDSVKVPTGIVGVISIDGVGAKANKIDTYDRIAPTLPKPWLPGFKLFYEEDEKAGGLMTGKDVMGLKPRPHVVLYE